MNFQMNCLKLTIELIPATCWYNNLRKKIDKEVWMEIQKQCFKDAGYQCQICESGESLHCHEVWEYDDIKRTQTLQGFKALCSHCHMIKHIGFANIQASKGLLSMEALIAHFLKVNQVERPAFREHYDQCAQQWKKRSKHSWKTDFGKWEALTQRQNKNSIYF